MPELLEISGLGDDNSGSLKKAGGFLLAMGGSIFILGVVLPALLGDTSALGLGIIKQCRIRDMKSGRARRSQKWCLWDSKGKRILGRHPSRNKALRQERLIQVRKHGG